MFHKQRGIQIEKNCDKATKPVKKLMAVNWLKPLALIGCSFLYGLSLLFYFQMGDIHIASLNVNGARDCVKRTVMYETMSYKKIDVLLVQETHSDVTNAVEWEK